MTRFKEIPSAEAVIIAGGSGQRMGGITDNAQKCLLPIDEKPILGHVMDSLSSAFGKTAVTICVSYRAQDVYDYVRRNKPANLTIDYLVDNGHSRTTEIYRSIKEKRRGALIGTAGDLVVEPSVYREGYDRVLEQGVFATVTLSPKLDEADTHAVGKLDQGRVTEIVLPAPQRLDEEHLRDMTIWGISQNFHEYADRYPHLTAIPRLFNQAIKDQEYVAGILYPGKWVHVAYPQDLKKTMK